MPLFSGAEEKFLATVFLIPLKKAEHFNDDWDSFLDYLSPFCHLKRGLVLERFSLNFTVSGSAWLPGCFHELVVNRQWCWMTEHGRHKDQWLTETLIQKETLGETDFPFSILSSQASVF